MFDENSSEVYVLLKSETIKIGHAQLEKSTQKIVQLQKFAEPDLQAEIYNFF